MRGLVLPDTTLGLLGFFVYVEKPFQGRSPLTAGYAIPKTVVSTGMQERWYPIGRFAWSLQKSIPHRPVFNVNLGQNYFKLGDRCQVLS